jgi:hypothetical protein
VIRITNEKKFRASRAVGVKGRRKSGKVGSRLVNCNHDNCHSRSTTAHTTPAELVTAGIMVAAIVLSITALLRPSDDRADTTGGYLIRLTVLSPPRVTFRKRSYRTLGHVCEIHKIMQNRHG